MPHAKQALKRYLPFLNTKSISLVKNSEHSPLDAAVECNGTRSLMNLLNLNEPLIGKTADWKKVVKEIDLVVITVS